MCCEKQSLHRSLWIFRFLSSTDINWLFCVCFLSVQGAMRETRNSCCTKSIDHHRYEVEIYSIWREIYRCKKAHFKQSCPFLPAPNCKVANCLVVLGIAVTFVNFKIREVLRLLQAWHLSFPSNSMPGSAFLPSKFL